MVRSSRVRRLLLAGLVAAVAEVPHWRASRCGLPGGAGAASDGPEVVLVLGSPTRRSGAVHPVQRWRTDIAVRSMAPGARLVFSGAGRNGGPSEEVMAGYARTALAVPGDRIVQETRARTTWENIAHTAGSSVPRPGSAPTSPPGSRPPTTTASANACPGSSRPSATQPAGPCTGACRAGTALSTGDDIASAGCRPR